MKHKLIKTFKTLIGLGLLFMLTCAAIPPERQPSSTSYTVRFTASYVSGNTGSKYVYYIVDSGSSYQMGTVSSSSAIDVTFTATFSNTVRVYVAISDDAIYNEHLYINGNLVANGNVGNGGLTYSRGDTTAPSGKITYPISGMIFTDCPIRIMATVSDDDSGVDWVIYLVKYDGVWHQIGTDDSSSSESGYGMSWDCSKVADQSLQFRISARDNAGNQGDVLGGDVVVNLLHFPTATSTPLPSNTPTPVPPSATPEPSLTPAFTQVPPTVAVTQPVATATPTETSIAAATQINTPPPPAGPAPQQPVKIVLCGSVMLPLLLGLSVLLWRNRP